MAPKIEEIPGARILYEPSVRQVLQSLSELVYEKHGVGVWFEINFEDGEADVDSSPSRVVLAVSHGE